MSPGAAALGCLAALAPLWGCAPPPSGDGARAGAIVYGVDDRRDYFAVSDERIRALLAASSVALVQRALLQPRGAALVADVPTLGALDELCPGEPFADQPAAAFCSGVLVDWDLVLTAGHCAHVRAVGDYAAVLGYYLTAPGVLDIQPADVIDVVEVVAERLDPPGSEPRVDYAWLRLAHRVAPPRAPAPVYRNAPPLPVGATVTSLSAVGGAPFKAAGPAEVSDLRAGWDDYFVAATDTSHGSSGGGAFDGALALAGVLARGGTDLVMTDAGCWATLVAPAADAQEQFTYTHQAVAGLCSDSPARSMCRADCQEPCLSLPPPPDDGGCAVSPHAPRSPVPVLVLVAVLVPVLVRRPSPRAGRVGVLRTRRPW